MFRKIVVGLDGSAPSENALRMACDLAQKYKSEIHLVHTPQPKTVAFALGAVAGYHTVTTMPADAEVEKAASNIIGSAMAIAKAQNQTVVQTHTQRGRPADEIVAYANDHGADLIVTGRRGLGNVSSLIQGSTTQDVNHQAQCACLSVV